MKKLKFYLFVMMINCFILAVNTNAQLNVGGNGYVGIISGAPYSPLTIGNTSGSANSTEFILSPQTSTHNYGLLAFANGCISNSSNYTSTAVYGQTYFPSSGASGLGLYRGVLGYAYQTTPVSYGKAYGVFGVAGNATTGYNYGVYGYLAGSHYGAAVYGGLASSIDVNMNDQYAGFFGGRVCIYDYVGQNVALWVNGTTWCTTSWSSSDSTLKHDIKLIDRHSLTPIFKLKAVSFKYNKPSSTSNKPDTSTNISSDSANLGVNSIYNKTLYGFIAQDVEKIYPNLVYTDNKTGIKMINYDSFIPLIIEALKEQNKINDTLKMQNDFLQQQISSCCTKNSLKSMASSSDGIAINDAAILYQNMPNPFSEKSEIKYLLPTSTQTAMICIYDLQGKQIKCINISGQGENSIVINGNELAAGMYLYTLIINNKEVDTKRMILTN
jgi:hypothetical protein